MELSAVPAQSRGNIPDAANDASRHDSSRKVADNDADVIHPQNRHAPEHEPTSASCGQISDGSGVRRTLRRAPLGVTYPEPGPDNFALLTYTRGYRCSRANDSPNQRSNRFAPQTTTIPVSAKDLGIFTTTYGGRGTKIAPKPRMRARMTHPEAHKVEMSPSCLEHSPRRVTTPVMAGGSVSLSDPRGGRLIPVRLMSTFPAGVGDLGILPPHAVVAVPRSVLDLQVWARLRLAEAHKVDMSPDALEHSVPSPAMARFGLGCPVRRGGRSIPVRLMSTFPSAAGDLGILSPHAVCPSCGGCGTKTAPTEEWGSGNTAVER